MFCSKGDRSSQGRSVCEPCRLRLRGTRKHKGGQREGDWKEASSRGGLVAKEPEFKQSLVGGSAGVQGTGLSHLRILSESHEGLAIRISESLLESSQRGVTEDTAGVPSARQCSQCEDGSKGNIVLQRE